MQDDQYIPCSWLMRKMTIIYITQLLLGLTFSRASLFPFSFLCNNTALVTLKQERFRCFEAPQVIEFLLTAVLSATSKCLIFTIIDIRVSVCFSTHTFHFGICVWNMLSPKHQNLTFISLVVLPRCFPLPIRHSS